jgi:hypothetical protein
MKRKSCVFGAVAAVFTLCACGSTKQSHIDILNPNVPQYGKTYAEWASAWIAYSQRYAPPDCADPVVDETGELCTRYQDEDSPVFFLVGNYGGVSRRDRCVVPAGKALFFPLLEAFGDNAGVPLDQLYSDETLRSYAESSFALMDASTLQLSVDGATAEGLERGAVTNTKTFTHFDSTQNRYACDDKTNVEGDFPGYGSGYWVMLAPLAPGQHTVEFSAQARPAPGQNGLTLDVHYAPLMVE